MTHEEALKLCLRVLHCLAEGRVYETRWVTDAINAADDVLYPREGWHLEWVPDSENPWRNDEN